MRRIGAGMSKCTSAIAAMVRSARSCIHVAERLAAVDHAGRVGVEVGDRGVDAGAGEDPLGGGVHQVGQPLQLGPAPGVGLVEVDLGAEEVAARERVDLAADPLALRALRLELVAEEQPERRGGGARGTRQRLAARRGRRPAGGRRGRGRSRPPRRSARSSGAPARPPRRTAGPRRRCPCGPRRRACTRRPSSAAGTAGQAGRDGRDGLLALGRHQVEDPADLVQGAPQHRHARAVDARLLQLDLQPGPLEEGVPGRRLAVVDRASRPRRRATARRGQRLAGVEAGGGEVGQLVLVPGHPDRGGGQRVEGAEVLDVGVAEGVDRWRSVTRAIVESVGHARRP